MIIKATKVKSIRHAGMLAAHLTRTDENEIVQSWGIRGTARPNDLDASLRSMQRATELTRGKTGLFHVAINPRDHEAEQMSEAEWERTIQAIEKEFGLESQPRAIMEHRKNGRSHLHVVYQLTDTDKGKLIDVKNDHYRCQALGRQLEKEFSHELTDNSPSRDTYSRDEQQQAKRLGESVADRRAGLRADYKQAKDLAEFRQLMEAKGYAIAQGDRASVVLMDEKGEVFGITRELGIKAKEVRQLFGKEIDNLPTIAELKKELQIKAEIEQAEPVQPVNGRDVVESQDLALAMINRSKQVPPEEQKTFSFTFNQLLKTPSDMLYSDLLSQQQNELEKLNIEFYQDREAIKQLQSVHYNPNEYDGQLERLEANFSRNQAAMRERFEVEQQEFLQETPALSDDLEPVVPPEPADIVSENQGKYIDILAQFRGKKANETVEKSDEDDPLKAFRYNPDDDPLKAFRHNPDDDPLKNFRSDDEEHKLRRQGGLGL